MAEGLSESALVESPVLHAMRRGKISCLEELTYVQSDVQDTLITILLEKTLPVSKLNTEVQMVKGLNLIATANNRDKDVNGFRGCLKPNF